MAEEHISGYGVLETYQADHADAIDAAAFDRYNRIASCMVDFLAGRSVDGDSFYVREAVHWQIWFMRQKGSVQACFTVPPKKEAFAEYSVERAETAEDGTVRLFGMEVCPMLLQLLRLGGVMSYWI